MPISVIENSVRNRRFNQRCRLIGHIGAPPRR